MALTVIAGILLGLRCSLALATLNIFVVLVIALLEINGYPFPHIFLEAPMVRWFDFSLFLIFTITPVYLILTSLSEALKRARKENEQRKEAEQEIRASEEYFRDLIENAQDIITVLDADGTIRFESPAIERVLGYTPDELIGKRVFDFMHPEDLKRILSMYKKGIQEAGKIERIEFRFKHRDGSWRHLEAIAQNLLHNSVAQGVVVNSRDVTEQKRLEKQFYQAQKMESIGRLAGSIAHDFNNILVPIIGYADLAMMDLPPENKIYANLKEIQKAAKRAASLTGQILAFSRKQVLEMQVIDLNTVIKNFEKMIHHLVGENIELSTSLRSDLYRVKADKGQIEQVLLNLVVNARDAMPQGGKLNIKTNNVYLDQAFFKNKAEAYPDGHYAMLAVSDTGCGMDAKIQQKIFEPFFTTKKQGKGTGLGLSTVFGIVKQHMGSITIYSEPGKGTTFNIYLPKAKGDINISDREDVEPPLHTGTETILVVEDDEMVKKIVCEALTSNGYKVIETRNVNDAVQRVSTYKGIIHLLLTDLIMPEMNGRELYQIIAATYPNIKVLYMSGYADNVIAHHGILDEGTNILRKPFSINNLTQRVKQVLS